MNKFFFQCFCATLLSYNSHVFSTVQTIPVQQITPQHLELIRSGAATDIAIAFEAGLHLPLQFVLTGDLVELTQTGKEQISIQKTFYVQNKEGELLFSTDLQNWSPLGAFITGNIAVGLSVEEGEIVTVLGVDANERQSCE